jgi:hypothetical protein
VFENVQMSKIFRRTGTFRDCISIFVWSIVRLIAALICPSALFYYAFRFLRLLLFP